MKKEKKNGEYRACLKYSVPIFVEYIKCNVWRLAVRYDLWVVRRQRARNLVKEEALAHWGPVRQKPNQKRKSLHIKINFSI